MRNHINYLRAAGKDENLSKAWQGHGSGVKAVHWNAHDRAYRSSSDYDQSCEALASHMFQVRDSRFQGQVTS